jgi:hypothetical protein
MGFFRWCKRHPVTTLVLSVGSTLLAFCLHWWYFPSVPSVSADDIKSIEVTMFPHGPRDSGGDVVQATTDPEEIQSLINVFETATRTSEHKCGNSGVMRIRRKSGDELELFLLPGHDAAYYEYRYAGRINRVDRAQLIAALNAIGIEKIKLDPP